MRILIIPDIHNFVYYVDKLIGIVPHDKVIFLGDYFDNFYDNPQIVEQTAVWLRHSLNCKNRIHLFGNHDIDYAYPHNNTLLCPGFTQEKSDRINKVLDKEHWDQLKLFHYEDNFFFSHAGINIKEIPFNPNYEPRNPIQLNEWLKECSKVAFKCAEAGCGHILLSYGTRMGWKRPGGLLWQDWDDFRAIPNINQIVGHTPDMTKVRFKYIPNKINPNSFNACLDTCGEYYGILEDGKFSYHKNILKK